MSLLYLNLPKMKIRSNYYEYEYYQFWIFFLTISASLMNMILDILSSYSYKYYKYYIPSRVVSGILILSTSLILIHSYGLAVGPGVAPYT